MDERECDFSSSFSSSSSSSSCSDSSSSSDDVESSSSSNNSSWNNISGSHNGPLYHMNSLLLNLPCKRGLSKCYGGKSQSFSCLGDVKCVEELSKESYYRRKKLKSSHSCGSRLMNNEKNTSSYEPRISSASMISKRPQKASKIMMSKKAVNFVMSSRPPLSLPKNAS